MLKKYLSITFILIPTFLNSYICNVTLLRNAKGAEILLFGDIHYKDPLITQEQVSIIKEKIIRLDTTNNQTKIWYEGPRVETQEIAKLKLNENDLLYVLSKLSNENNFYMQNVDNREHLAEKSFLEAKMGYGNNLQESIDYLKSTINSSEKENDALNNELQFLTQVSNAPSKKELAASINEKIEKTFEQLYANL